MLYLEDYLEMIEHLPQELRDRFTEMRELDLSVQNTVDSLDKQQRSFFARCKQTELPEEEIESEYEALRKEYHRVLEDADEKVNISSQIHELVERYLRRLDSELFKFKCELEADNNGITEILEKRSLEMDSGCSAASALLIGANQKENRYYGSTVAGNNHTLHGPAAVLAGGSVAGPPPPTPGANKEGRYRPPKPEKRRDSISTLPVLPDKRPSLSTPGIGPGASPVPVVRPVTPNVNNHATVLSSPAAAAAAVVTTPTNASAVAYNLQQLGGAGSASNAIAAAASQAIMTTQQMQQGRRTASLKASYEAIHGAGGGPTEFWISRDIASAASAAAAQTVMGATEKKQKKKASSVLATQTQTTTMPPSVPAVNLGGTVTLASSSSSVSLDSTDLLSSSVSLVNTVGGIGPAVPPLSMATLGVGGASTSATAAANRTNSASSSTSTASSLTPSSNLNIGENGLVVDQAPEGEWSYDPNEPRYCTCQQVSYGDMVACDNDACPYEWFHYPCVGITQPPKGKWYCPKCTASMRRRGNRKN